MTACGEDGFTLIELLVTITILTIVAGVFGEAAAQGLKVTFSASQSLIDSAGAPGLSGHLRADVHGAQSMGTVGGPACGPPASATRVLWTANADPGTAAADIAAYSVEAVPSSGYELVRQTCAGGAPPSAPTAPVVLATWSSSAAALQITCDGRPDCGGATTLKNPASSTDTALSLNASLDPAHGFPAGAPAYTLTVGALGTTSAESMTVVGNFGSDTPTVSRPAAVSHLAGDPVTYAPALVDLCIPQDSAPSQSGPCPDGDFSLAIARLES